MYRDFKYKIFDFQRFILKIVILIFLIIFNFYDNYGFENKPFKIKTVVIDPGHGGKDPGCICNRGYEKEVALSVSLKLGNYIKSNFNDVRVIYTRSTDEFVELYKRAEIANTNKADLFICIHANTTKNKDVYGTETFVMGLSKTAGNLEVAKLENSAILHEDNYSKQYEGFDPHSPEGNIIFSLYQNAYLEQSINLADKVEHQFKKNLGRFDRGVKQAGFLVLWKTAMPSILIELGFLSNPKESAFLFSDNGQEYMASAIFRAFRKYKNEMEGDKSIIYSDDTLYTNYKEENKNDSIKNIVLGNDTNKLKHDSIVKNSNDTLNKAIVYKIQFYSSPKSIPLNSKIFRNIPDVEESKEGKLYKYTSGNTTSYNEMLAQLKIIRTKFKDAFPVQYKNGVKISMNNINKNNK